MILLKTLADKLQLVIVAAMLSVSLLNGQTANAYITPGGDSDRVTPTVPRYPQPTPRPGSGPIRPTPTPRPGNPYPMPQPSYPHPYPGPVYPGPVYPSPSYPRPSAEFKTMRLNRWVYSETFYMSQLLNYSYNYSGYRLRNVRVDVGGNSSARINLIVNGRVIDSEFTSGQDVYLYPNSYNDDLDLEISSLAIQVNGSAYIYSIVFELERRY